MSRTCLRCNFINDDTDLLKKGGVVKARGSIHHFRCVRCWTPLSWKADKKPTRANKEIEENTWQYSTAFGDKT